MKWGGIVNNHIENTCRKGTKLGLQGPVIAWQDAWAGELSDEIMRTGTGSVYPSQDPTPTPKEFVHALKDMGADFYVHHMFPNLTGQSEMIEDMMKYDMELCIGNEYGNINGPYIEGTNRYDVPDESVLEAARSGKLIGLLYDEPAHLQINAGQYRKDGFFPHWGKTDGLTLTESNKKVISAVSARVGHVKKLIEESGLDPEEAPLIAEHVFPVMFHTHARGGMQICPKTMKESFQSLQLSTALGAAKQYSRKMWICTDLWGPDVGPWFTRTSGFPGHSPKEYASALRMSYYMGPTHLFTENIDVLLKYQNKQFRKTEFGEVWDEFVHKFVPENPISWTHLQAEPDIVFIHSDDSNYGQNERLFGNQSLAAPETTQSIFHVWHLLSHGTIPVHGSCMHIPGYDFPRHRLKQEIPTEKYPLEKGPVWGSERQVHPLFYPINNVLVYDNFVEERQIGNAKLILAAGSHLSSETLNAIRNKANSGAIVIIASWLTPKEWMKSGRVGKGLWVVTEDFLQDYRVREIIKPHLGNDDCWVQRFGDKEVRMYKGDSFGSTLNFEVMNKSITTY
jgi:hypothetical protein